MAVGRKRPDARCGRQFGPALGPCQDAIPASGAALAQALGQAVVSPPVSPASAGSHMRSFYLLVDTALGLYWWAVIIHVILSWLTAFNVINTYNRFVAMVDGFLDRVTEPALRPIRNFLPRLGGIDVSPVVLLIFIWFLRNLLWEYWGSAV